MTDARHIRLTKEQLAAMLAEKKNTVILLHARPDGDAVGSAFALCLMLQEMGMRAYCLCADEIPARLRFLIEGVQQSLLPESLPADFSVERVVSVDVASPAQLGALGEHWMDRVDVMIDHHATGELFAPALVEPDASATGELIFELGQLWLEQGKRTGGDARINELTFASIASDTGGFRYSNVTARTHRIAAELVESGVDTSRINHALFESKPYELMLCEQLGFSAMRRFEEGKISLIPLSYEVKQQYGLLNEHMETLSDVARSVEGTQVAIAIRQPTEQGCFRVSVRSNGAFSAAALCAALGGGGHEKAAGCTVQAPDMEAAIELILRTIREKNLL